MILDEPTSSLSETESAILFRVIADLQANGVSILYISHRLPDVFALCDTITVLRDGRHVRTVPTAATTEVLIVDEPTRGVDIGTKAEIYTLFDELVREGIAILVISSDLPEVLALADRILIMRHGRLTGELARADATEEKVMHLAAIGSASIDAEINAGTEKP